MSTARCCDWGGCGETATRVAVWTGADRPFCDRHARHAATTAAQLLPAEVCSPAVPWWREAHRLMAGTSVLLGRHLVQPVRVRWVDDHDRTRPPVLGVSDLSGVDAVLMASDVRPRSWDR